MNPYGFFSTGTKPRRPLGSFDTPANKSEYTHVSTQDQFGCRCILIHETCANKLRMVALMATGKLSIPQLKSTRYIWCEHHVVTNRKTFTQFSQKVLRGRLIRCISAPG